MELLTDLVVVHSTSLCPWTLPALETKSSQKYDWRGKKNTPFTTHPSTGTCTDHYHHPYCGLKIVTVHNTIQYNVILMGTKVINNYMLVAGSFGTRLLCMYIHMHAYTQTQKAPPCLPWGVGLLLVEVYTGHACPGQGIGVEELGKELGHIAQLVGLQSVHCRILWG